MTMLDQFCPRCGKTLAGGSIMSRFNTEQICLDCQDRERQHSDYAAAAQAEEEAVRRGDTKFAGIGKPSDL
jgi:hypothetical protein